MVKRLIAIGVLILLMATVTNATPAVMINGEEGNIDALAASEIETMVNVWNVDQAAAAEQAVNNNEKVNKAEYSFTGRTVAIVDIWAINEAIPADMVKKKSNLDNTALKALVNDDSSEAIGMTACVFKLPFSTLIDGSGIVSIEQRQKPVQHTLVNGLVMAEATIIKIPCQAAVFQVDTVDSFEVALDLSGTSTSTTALHVIPLAA